MFEIERYPENHRERFLSADELARLGATLRQAETVGLSWKSGGCTLYRRVATAASSFCCTRGAAFPKS